MLSPAWDPLNVFSLPGSEGEGEGNREGEGTREGSRVGEGGRQKEELIYESIRNFARVKNKNSMDIQIFSLTKKPNIEFY